MINFLEKQRNILDFALSSLLRHKGKNLALLLVYTLIVFILASVMFFTQALKKEASLVLSSTPEIIVQKLVAGRHDLIPLDYIDKINKIRGVSAVHSRLWGYYYDAVTQANFTVLAAAGAALTDQTVVVGEGIARVRRVQRGAGLRLRTYDGRFISFKIKGIMSPESALISSDLILVTAADFHRLFGLPEGCATDLIVTVRNKKEIPMIAAKILQILPDTRPLAQDEILRTYDAVFDWRGGILLVILSPALLAFLIFAWDKASGMSAREQREIGILKAIGWETGDVLQLKFWEGLAISLTSFLLGVLLAYVHIFLFSSPLFSSVLKGWSVLYPEFKLSPFISVYQLAVLLFFSVIPYTIATIVPSWKAAATDPDLVMRL